MRNAPATSSAESPFGHSLLTLANAALRRDVSSVNGSTTYRVAAGSALRSLPPRYAHTSRYRMVAMRSLRPFTWRCTCSCSCLSRASASSLCGFIDMVMSQMNSRSIVFCRCITSFCRRSFSRTALSAAALASRAARSASAAAACASARSFFFCAISRRFSSISLRFASAAAAFSCSMAAFDDACDCTTLLNRDCCIMESIMARVASSCGSASSSSSSSSSS
mmetsp:Transcript_7064/g.17007  ORF Transcript_7064/g.17007 Transcript_7064/m.17007 type:complete len:222 (-) Transcript_7064:340-1005(-)